MTEVLVHTPLAEIPIADVVDQLVIALGEYLTAIIANAPDSLAVRAWQAGTAAPTEPERLRFALEIVRRLSADHGNSRIHAWFSTVGPEFGEMPARVIGRRPLAEIRERMLQSLSHEGRNGS